VNNSIVTREWRKLYNVLYLAKDTYNICFKYLMVSRHLGAHDRDGNCEDVQEEF
jgi:hypothetical protein